MAQRFLQATKAGVKPCRRGGEWLHHRQGAIHKGRPVEGRALGDVGIVNRSAWSSFFGLLCFPTKAV
jgi:hypothetical protein